MYKEFLQINRRWTTWEKNGKNTNKCNLLQCKKPIDQWKNEKLPNQRCTLKKGDIIFYLSY